MSLYIDRFTFDFQNSVALGDTDVTEVSCIDFYQTCKSAQASEEGILYDPIAIGSGLKSLGAGVTVGLTVELLGKWQVKFAEGTGIARVASGNLIGGLDDDPVAYTAGVQVLLIQSAASTVVTAGGAGSGLTVAQDAKLTAIKATTDLIPALL